MEQLLIGNELLRHIRESGGRLTVKQHWIWLQCPSRRAFIDVQEEYGYVLQAWAESFLVLLSHPGNQYLYRVPKKGAVMTTDIFAEISTLRLTPNLLRVIDEMLNNADKAQGLVRLSDERQVCMPKSNEPYLMGLQLSESVSLHRRDFWHPQDLEEFRRISLQQLEPDNPDSKIIFTFRSFDPKVGWPSPIDSTFTNEYRLVSDGMNNMFHLSTHLDMELT